MFDITNAPRSLRESTQRQSEEIKSKPRVLQGRKYVPLEKGSSIKLPEGHSCTAIYPDCAQDKAQRRFLLHFVRYTIADILDCKTSRGKTLLQCGKSTCDCESAHFAATPTMYDDKMRNVMDVLNKDGPLTPTKVAYVMARLNLDSPTKRNFNALTSSEKVDFIRARISPGDNHSSFNKTAFELQLSGTIEGSVIANDFDQFIEGPIRKLEDQHSEKINGKNQNAQQAIEATYRSTRKIIETSISNLEKRKQQLEDYLALEQLLDGIEIDYLSSKNIARCDQYAQAAAQLLDLKNKLIERLQYCTNYDKGRFNQYCQRLDFFWIKAFVATYGDLETKEDKEQAFMHHMQSVKKEPTSKIGHALEITAKMLQEAYAQQAGIKSIGKCNLANLQTHLFGVCENGVRRAPTQDELKQQVIEMTRKVSEYDQGTKRKRMTSSTQEGANKKIKIDTTLV